MTSDNRRLPLILLQSAPYDGSLARAALDLALAFAVFAQEPRLLFSGSAVLSLTEAQDAAAIGRKSLRKVIDSLPLYDVDTVYVDQASLADNGLAASSLPDFAVPLSPAEIRGLIREASHVISL